MHRRDASLAFLFLTVSLASLGVAGCGEDFEDDYRGVLDLSSAYDGGTPQNPAAGLPEEIYANYGYVDGEPAEYYDFGVVPTINDPATREPVAARVQPMYFFFDQQERPLFSRPVREKRDNVDWMRGGPGLLDPNPKDFCAGLADRTACTQVQEAERKKTYPQRRRDPLVDPLRLVSDYQRPLVDVSPLDTAEGNRQYTGLWEVVEVMVPNGYSPDAIKHVGTLERALASGKFKKRHTGKVINCPIIDDRTYVRTGVTSRDVYRPRIEIWYRRLLGSCYLVNGWETLGNAAGELLFASFSNPDGDRQRLQTFDVSPLAVGDADRALTRLVVPISRAYAPAVFTDDQSFVNPPIVTQIADNYITASRARSWGQDLPGYSPMRWMFDVEAPGDYRSGTWQKMSDVDLAVARPQRRPGGTPVVRNLALRGVSVPCSFGPVPEVTKTDYNKQCGRYVQDPRDPDNPNSKIVDPKGDPRCNALGLECNRQTCYCDVPIVEYGQRCGPGIARCKGDCPSWAPCPDEIDSFSEYGYRCFPPWGGFCQLKCGGTNTRAKENEGQEDLTKLVDSRCKNIPGFVCYPGLQTCIKFCDQNKTDMNQCAAAVPLGMQSVDIQAGQTCQDFGLQVCAWPDSWTPTVYPIP